MFRIKDIQPLTPYGNYTVDISWKYLPIVFKEWDMENGLVLNPDFQREHVWTEEQQIKYVEFCLRGGKTGRIILFNSKGWGSGKGLYPIVLVDGKQRVYSVRKFLNNKLKVFGHFLNEYEDGLNSVRDRFHVYINNLETKKEVLQWYLDLNDGGTIHTQEELNKVRNMIKHCHKHLPI